MPRQFMGREISKEVIALGTAGMIERGPEELPPRSLVHFAAQATASSIKHKFLEDGTVEEMTVLTILADTFEVLDVEKAHEQPELPLATDTTDPPTDTPPTEAVPAEEDLVPAGSERTD